MLSLRHLCRSRSHWEGSSLPNDFKKVGGDGRGYLSMGGRDLEESSLGRVLKGWRQCLQKPESIAEDVWSKRAQGRGLLSDLLLLLVFH